MDRLSVDTINWDLSPTEIVDDRLLSANPSSISVREFPLIELAVSIGIPQIASFNAIEENPLTTPLTTLFLPLTLRMLSSGGASKSPLIVVPPFRVYAFTTPLKLTASTILMAIIRSKAVTVPLFLISISFPIENHLLFREFIRIFIGLSIPSWLIKINWFCFLVNKKMLKDYPNLWRYARDLYSIPAFGKTTDFEAIKKHYHLCAVATNPNKILPKGPDTFIWKE